MMFGKRFPIEQILRRNRHSRRAVRSNNAAQYVRTESLEERLLLAADVADALFNAAALDQFGDNPQVDSYLARFDQQQTIANLEQYTGATVVASSLIPNGYYFTYDTPVPFQAAVDEFSTIDGFDYFQPNVAPNVTTRFVPNDPLFNQQYHLLNSGQENGSTVGADINVTDVWDTYRGGGITIAVLDDGLEVNHEDLAPNILAGQSFDFSDGDTNPSPGTTDNHGTAVAGVAAGAGNNGLGISGAAFDANLIGLRILAPGVTIDEFGQALGWTNVDVSNNSWGPSDDGALHAISAEEIAGIRRGINTGRNGLGTVYTWAAGNGGTGDFVNYDEYASSRYTIAVGAIDENGKRSSFSEAGSSLLVTTYSNGNIRTTDQTGDRGYNATGTGDGDPIDPNYTSTFSGTSSAAPLAAGVVALMLDANSGLSWRDVQDILARTSVKTDPNHADWVQNGDGLWVNHDYGFGSIDADAAVNAALTHRNLQPEKIAKLPQQSPGLAIPDNNANGISQTVTTNSTLKVESVEVVVNATHTNRGNLEITLTSPAGTKSTLAKTRTTDPFANYTNWTFTSVRHWGELADGDWTITVADKTAGDTGTLDSFQIIINGAEFDIPVPAAPRMVAPSGQIADSSPLYRWTGVTFGETYELEVMNSVGTVVVDETIQNRQTTFDQTSNLVEGTYQSRVRAINTDLDVGPWSELLTFSVNVPTPAIPEFITPVDRQILTDPIIAFDWTSVQFGDTYNLVVENVQTGERVVFVNELTQSSYTHHNAFVDGDYRALVQAKNSVNEASSFSAPITFTVDAPAPGRPTVTGPTGVTPVFNPTITWSNVAGAVRYELWVNSLTTGQSRVIHETQLTGVSYTPATPLPQGTYRIWVRAFNPSDQSEGWSLPVQVTIDVPQPGHTRITGPQGNPVANAQPLISWTSATNAAMYQLWVNNDTEKIPRVIFEVVEGNTFRVSDVFLPDGRYKAFIRAINLAGEVGPWSSGFTFNVDDPAPAIPIFVGPAINAVGTHPDLTPLFEWTGRSEAVRYDLWVNDLTSGEKQVIRRKNLTNNRFESPNPLVDGHTYAAWVRAFNGTGETLGWSQAYTFRLFSPTPGTPVLLSPDGTAVDAFDQPTATPKFVWTHSQDAVTYQLFIRELTNNDVVRVNINDVFVDSSTQRAEYTLEQPLGAGTYQAWVRAFNASGDPGGWSDPISFVIESLASSDTGRVRLPLLKSVDQDANDTSDAEPILPVQQPIIIAQADTQTRQAIVQPTAPMTPTPIDVPPGEHVSSDDHIESVMTEWVQTEWWNDSLAAEADESQATDIDQVAETHDNSNDQRTAAAAALPVMLVAGRRKPAKRRKN